MTQSILLTQNKYAVVDDDDYVNLSQYHWYFGGDGYAVRTRQKNEGKRSIIKMHRWILSAPKGFDVDHINGNRLDNRKCNLRVCNRSQNNANRHMLPHNKSSQYKGVCWRNHANAWKAYIKINRLQIHLGYFKSETDAAKMYNFAAKHLFGEFAHLNQV